MTFTAEDAARIEGLGNEGAIEQFVEDPSLLPALLKSWRRMREALANAKYHMRATCTDEICECSMARHNADIDEALASKGRE